MSTDFDTEGFVAFDASAVGSKNRRQGDFISIHRTQSGSNHRRAYLSADLREFLDDPTYIRYHISTGTRRLAIEKTTKGDDNAYKLPPTSHSVAIELPLRELEVENVDGTRIGVEYVDDMDWAVIDFRGGAPDVE